MPELPSLISFHSESVEAIEAQFGDEDYCTCKNHMDSDNAVSGSRMVSPLGDSQGGVNLTLSLSCPPPINLI